jgi:hypothetical protein
MDTEERGINLLLTCVFLQSKNEAFTECFSKGYAQIDEAPFF